MGTEYDKSEIERSDIDNYWRRNSSKDSFKNRKFDRKRTIKDEYTGKKIHYSQTEKGTLKGKDVANTDHVTPIEVIKQRYGDSLPAEDLNEMTNADANLAMTNQQLNQSKGQLTNGEYLLKQWKEGKPVNATTTYNMLKVQVQSEVAIFTDANGRKIANAASKAFVTAAPAVNQAREYAVSGLNAGMDVAIVTMTISTINNIVLCASGEKSVKEAGKEILQMTGSSFVAGTAVDILQRASMDLAGKSGFDILSNVANGGLPVAEISAAIMISNSVIKYVNGDIDGEQCVTEILMNGAGVIAYSLGMSVGGPAGAVIASVICSQVCKAMIDYKNIEKLSKEKLARVNSIATEALTEMEYQRNILKNMVKEKYQKWDSAFDNGFEHIFISTLNNDVEGISSGLNRILSIFGETVSFSSREEFNEFFDDEKAVLTL
ncbi:MAG: hypothetical protein AB7G87_13520 [Clostridia bacterium]